MQWFSGTRTLCRWSRMLLDIKMPRAREFSSCKVNDLGLCAHCHRPYPCFEDTFDHLHLAKMQWFSGTRTLCRRSGSVRTLSQAISLLSQTKRSAEQCTKQSQSTEVANCSLKTLGWTNLTSSIHGKCCTKQSQSTEAANCALKTLGWTNLTSSIHGKCWHVSFSKTSIMCR